MTRTLAFVVAVVLASALMSTPAMAAAPPTPWNGANPFNCTIQNAGQGTTVPDPGADPYCVYFDKTNQNVTELGLITFLTEEPARTAAAGPKCFYFQEDHWRGSVIQSDQQTVIYEFVGHYFFNKATGDGGVWVTGFTLGGQTFDPRDLPGFPAQYDQDFGPGTGGFITHNDVPADPSCVAQASQSPGSVYASQASPCLSAHGAVTHHGFASVGLGAPRARVRKRLGQPQSASGRLLRYCLRSGGSLVIAGSRASPHHTTLVLATGDAFTLSGRGRRTVIVGSTLADLHAAFPGAKRTLHGGHGSVFRLTGQGRRGAIVVGVAHGRVTYLATYDPSRIRSNRALAGLLRQAQ
ncbi:MAG TPA: hypothetical protein VMD09_16005 [Solirubrobacteraceae bacterium]|nr:hypothetical protein [Solirubrobacteraceae bacterium]